MAIVKSDSEAWWNKLIKPHIEEKIKVVDDAIEKAKQNFKEEQFKEKIKYLEHLRGYYEK